MGGYILSGKEIADDFEKFLKKISSGEGDITAETIANAWDIVATKNGWNDRLEVEYEPCPKCGDPSGYSDNYCCVCGHDNSKEKLN